MAAYTSYDGKTLPLKIGIPFLYSNAYAELSEFIIFLIGFSLMYNY